MSTNSAISGVRNPLPASGGVDPETIEHVRQSAPTAFRIQERAVTPADYAEVAERHPGIQQAAATFRWTGSWRTVFLAVDRLGGLEVDGEFKSEIRAHMERYRMAGQDLEIDGPLYVSLEIEMTVCAKADYFRRDVKEALLKVFSNRMLPDGTRGVFHPDNFSFGQTVYLSPLYAAAMKVEGVAAVKITTFQRQASPDPKKLALKAGKLDPGTTGDRAARERPEFSGTRRVRLENGGWKMSGSVDPSLRNLNDCGCCAGVTVETPRRGHLTGPALSAIAYRVGTHALFKQSLLARLSGSDLPALRGLKTRETMIFPSPCSTPGPRWQTC